MLWFLLQRWRSFIAFKVSESVSDCLTPSAQFFSYHNRVSVIVILFNVTFNNISVISWRSALLVEKSGVPVENHRPAASHWQTLSHNFVSSTPRHEQLPYYHGENMLLFNVCFVVDQHTWLDVYSVSSLKHQSTCNHFKRFQLVQLSDKTYWAQLSFSWRIAVLWLCWRESHFEERASTYKM